MFGVFGPPKKHVNFNELFNFSVSICLLNIFLSSKLFVFLALWSSQPFKLPSFFVSKLFGPPTAGCLVVDFKDWGGSTRFLLGSANPAASLIVKQAIIFFHLLRGPRKLDPVCLSHRLQLMCIQ